MAKVKYHVFSARTTEDGLKALNQLKEKLGVSWDELVIDAVCGHYGMDKAMMSLPKKEKAAKQEKDGQQVPAEEVGEERPTESGEKKPAKKQRKATAK